MKLVLVLLLCFLVPSAAFAADNSNDYKVMYDGGSVGTIKSGANAHLIFDAKEIRLVEGKETLATIPADSVTEISYGQDVHRRVGSAIALGVISLGAGALLALSKSKKHFIGITWANGDQKGGFAMQCDKNDYRGVLAGLEGITGKKAVNSETLTVKN